MSPDVDLGRYAPLDRGGAAVFVEFEIGAEGQRGADLFGLTFLTPRSLSGRIESAGPLTGRHLVVVSEWNWPEALEFMTDSVEACVGDSWDVIGPRLANLGHWEFEDYRELGEPERPEVAPAGESMSATIKGWSSPDVDLDVWEPKDADNVGLALDLSIGNTSTDDTARFRVVVATPDWLAEQAMAGPIIGWGMVIVSRWDWMIVADFLDGVIGREWGRSWEELVERLGRIGKPVAACD